MIVRKLKKEEYYEGECIATMAFHWSLPTEEDRERLRQKSLTAANLHYGAFTDDGRMMARIMNDKYVSRLDGHRVRAGGIGGVSTLPEYRETGCIRRIFDLLLPDAYRDGEVLSYLYPFNISFYRKFGYEAAPWKRNYRFKPAVLKDYHFSGDAILYRDGDSLGEYTELYNRYADSFNVAFVRDEKCFYEDHLKGEWYVNRKFTYLLRQDGENVAYVSFQDEDRELAVQDMAFLGRKGFNAILGFLARFSADYKTILLPLPTCIELGSVIHSRDIYDVDIITKQSFMVRVVNAREALSAIRKPENTRFVIQVTGDEQIAENNRTYLVTDSAVTETEEAPDLSVTIQTLGQLVIGVTGLFEAELREGTEVLGSRDTLEKVFVRKPWMIQDHF